MDSRWLSDSSTDPRTRETLLIKCKSAIEGLTQDLDQEHRLRLQSDRKIKSLGRDLNALREDYERCRRKDETFGEEVEAEGRERATLRKKVAGLEEEVSHLSEDRQALGLKYAAAMEELRTAQDLLEQARREVAEKQAAMEGWEEVVREVDAKLHSLSSENEELKIDREKYAENCEKLLSHNEKLEEMWKSAKLEVQELSGKLEKLREQHMNTVTDAERERARQHQSLTESFSQKTLQIHEELQRELREQRGKCDFTAQENAKLVEEMGKLGEIVNGLKSQIQGYKGDMELAASAKKSLEIELSKRQSELETVLSDSRKEAELREKLHNGAVVRMEEELRAHDQTRRRVEELSTKLAQSEMRFSGNGVEYERRIDDLALELRRKNSENEDLRTKIAKIQQESGDALNRLKKDNFDSLQKLQLDSSRLQSDILQSLEAKIKELEAQRTADHEQYQLDILRLKDDYTQALIVSGEELKDLRSERNRSRGTITELERRLGALNERMEGRSGRREDGARVLGQLREITSRMERAVPAGRFQ